MFPFFLFFFQQENVKVEPNEINLVKSIDADGIGDWIEDSRRVYSEQFKNGIKTTRYQMIRLVDNSHMQVFKFIFKLFLSEFHCKFCHYIFVCVFIRFLMSKLSELKQIIGYLDVVLLKLINKHDIGKNIG